MSGGVVKREAKHVFDAGKYVIYRELCKYTFEDIWADYLPDPEHLANMSLEEIQEHIDKHAGELPEYLNSRSYIHEIAYTHDGHYIGPPERARMLYFKYGIFPELADPDDNVCSIGFSPIFQRWYGWSHRAMYGFAIGDCVDSDEHLCAHTGYIDGYLESLPEEERLKLDKSLPVGFTAKNLDDCKRMALAFAESVS